MITQDRMERALRYLAETDADYATERAEVERQEILRKRARARIFLTSEGTVAERQAQAEVHDDVIMADLQRDAALLKMEKLRAKRDTEALVCDMWRTLEASRRKGA